MRQTIGSILENHNIHDLKLLENLNKLFTESMRASKELGKRSLELTEKEEKDLWHNIYLYMVDVYCSEASAFANLNIDQIKERYILYRRGRTNK